MGNSRSTILRKVRADQWSDRASEDLRTTVEQLRRHFQGRTDFSVVTYDWIASSNLVGAAQLRFLTDRRVTFFPFTGADPDDTIVIRVRLERGFLMDGGFLTETKGAITTLQE